MVGQFQGSNIFVDGFNSSTTLLNSGLVDSYLYKFDTSLVPIWGRKFGGSSWDRFANISFDTSGNPSCFGYYLSSGIIENGVTLPAPDDRDPIWIRYNKNTGNTIKAVWANGTVESDIAWGFVQNEFGEKFVVGTFLGTITFLNGMAVTSNGGDDSFVIKYKSNDTIEWVKKIGVIGNDVVRNIRLGTDSTIIL